MRNRFALVVATCSATGVESNDEEKESVIRPSGKKEEKSNIVALNPSDGERHHMCSSVQSVETQKKKMNETETFGLFSRAFMLLVNAAV